MLAVAKRVAGSLLYKNKFVSSANNFDLACGTAYWISFMYIKNSNGPNTDRWGTP